MMFVHAAYGLNQKFVPIGTLQSSTWECRPPPPPQPEHNVSLWTCEALDYITDSSVSACEMSVCFLEDWIVLV